jgi:uncharacterized membrane protein
VKVESDLNTYLQLWEEEELRFDEIPSLNTLYIQLITAQEVSHALSKLLYSLKREKLKAWNNGNSGKASKMNHYILKMLRIVKLKWDISTQKILQAFIILTKNMDLFPRENTENFQLTSKKLGYSVGIWGNVTRNPRC